MSGTALGGFPHWSAQIAPVQTDQGLADPSSSSYELKAITDDFGLTHQPGDPRDPWLDHEDGDSYRRAVDELIKASATGSSPDALTSVADSPSTSYVESGPHHSAIDPWYSRVLEAWGVFFLIWASVISVRSLFSLLAPGASSPLSRDLVSAVFSVLLLVPGAACIFLLVDVGRYIRDLRLQAPTREFLSKTAGATPFALRSWRLKSWIHRSTQALSGR
jgi:hypothetical protein